VLIVDEINRANLAKVFGELYFLLEYRDAKIGLQYSPDKSFSLPRNVFFIGTMNTADRSIALVDAAIRRRFAFIELHPDEPPVRDLLANWLAASHKAADERAGLLRALNQAIGEEDRDFKIGPSYLMRPEAERPAGLERVWLYDLLPLLEEHYYGRLTRSQVHARFGLEATRARLAQVEAGATVRQASPEAAGQ
jgi:5-methylcytosine-specific restriction protein B